MSIKVFEAFSGVGAQVMALRNIAVDYTSVGVAEVNEPAILAYAAIHADNENIPIPEEKDMQEYMERLNIPLNDKGKRIILKNKRLIDLYKASRAINNLGDISKIKTEAMPDIDLFTYSFPCQSISFAGLGHGFKKGSNTRSSLLWECERIIEDKRPPFLLMENVKALVSKRFMPDFKLWCDLLENLGYRNYWQVLNAKDFGIPQNRERVFMISIRKDIDKNYKFPEKTELNIFIKDILEDNVPDNFFLKKEQIDNLILSDKLLEDRLLKRIGNSNPSGKGMNGEVYAGDNNIIPTLTTNKGEGLKIALSKIGNINPSGKGIGGQVYDSQSSISPTVLAEHDYIHISLPKIGASRGRYVENPKSRISGLPTSQHLELNESDTSNALTSVQKDNYVVDYAYLGNNVHPLSKKLEFNQYKNFKTTGTLLATDYKAPKTVAIYQRPRGYNKGGLIKDISPVISSHSWHENNLLLSDVLTIRKLTPRECWRLMGFSDDDFNKASNVTSNTQLYKQAGNSIVVPVLEGIFHSLFVN